MDLARWKTTAAAMSLLWPIGHNLMSQTPHLPTSATEPVSSSTAVGPYFDVVSIRPVDMTKDTSGWGLGFNQGHFKGYQITTSMLGRVYTI